MQRIPLDNSPNQNFDIALEINGQNKIFNLFLSYNPNHYWTIRVRDSKKNPITDDIPLLSGGDLFYGLDYLEIGEAYLLRKSGVTEEIPNENTLESDYVLIWGDKNA